METLRSPFQGVWNIVRFNWPFYMFGVMLLIIILIGIMVFPSYHALLLIVFGAVVIPTILSLAVSYYVYDLSDLYQFKWLDNLSMSSNSTIINVHAGFDETSVILNTKFPNAILKAFDFYDPIRHTEPSIKRAREAYPAFANTVGIRSTSIPMKGHSVDYIFVIFSAHEIRNDEERILFFRELKRVLKPSGRIIVVEHLRDLANFAAYNVGFLHFISRDSWMKTFAGAQLVISGERKVTPFITTFILK